MGAERRCYFFLGENQPMYGGGDNFGEGIFNLHIIYIIHRYIQSMFAITKHVYAIIETWIYIHTHSSSHM